MVKRVCFLSILGEPGSYDPAVYDLAPGGDNECRWVQDSFAYLDAVEIAGVCLPKGDPIPAVASADAFILGGSYNSVHDDLPWQRALLDWFNDLADADKPLLAICGGHQLLGQYFSTPVGPVESAPMAGTMSVSQTEAGRRSPLFRNIGDDARFHFANYEHVTACPPGATVLATHTHMPAAALAYSDTWFSIQFHPEAEAESIAISWRPTHPAFADRYHDDPAGKRMIENFLSVI